MSIQSISIWVTPVTIAIFVGVLGFFYARRKIRLSRQPRNIKPTFFGYDKYPKIKFAVYQGEFQGETFLRAEIIPSEQATGENATILNFSDEKTDEVLTRNELEYKAVPDAPPDRMEQIFIVTCNLISAYQEQEKENLNEEEKKFLTKLFEILYRQAGSPPMEQS